MVFSNSQWFTAPSSGAALVEVENSALYVDGNSEFLVRTLSGAGTSRKTFTLGGWFYKTKVGSGSDCRIFQWDNGSTNIDRGMILIDNTVPDAIKLLIEDASDVATMIWTTTQLIRDQAWYHWCLTVNTVPSTPIFKFFLNNEEITAWTKGTDTIAQDDVFTIVDSGARQAWGSAPEGEGYFDGYMAECFLLDGQVVTDATDFVDVSADGLYITPKSNAAMKALTFGDEGFYLDNATNAETDASGNGNNFTNTNTVTLSTNTPTNLENRWNPLWYTTGETLSNGNKTGQVTNSGNQTITSTLTLPSTGKWYIELDCDTESYSIIGLLNANGSGGEPPFNQGDTVRGYYQVCELYGYISSNGVLFTKGNGASGNSASYGTAYDNSDYIGIAADCDNGNLFFSKSDTWQNSATAGEIAAGTGTNAATTALDNEYVVVLFGAGATEKFTFVDEADWSGTAPTGFIALTTTNIAAETTRTAADTTKYFDTILYEGNGDGQRVGQFQPFGNAFTVGNSALFNGTNYLARTPSSTGSTTIATFSRWVKRITPGNQDSLFSAYISSTQLFQIYFPTDNTLHVYNYSSGYDWQVATNRVFEDSSQWFHVYIAIDTTEGASSDRVKIYINGVQETSLGTASYPSSSFANDFNTDTVVNNLGPYNGATGSGGLEGYTSETAWVDGTIYAPSYFGQTDTSTNRWIPKALAGITWGTNGFYQDYADSDNVGDDESGNGNDFSNNGTVVQTTDSPTTNYPTLAVQAGVTLSNGNLTCVPTTTYGQAKSGLNFSSQKIFACCLINDGGSGAEVNTTFALAASTYMPNASNSPGTDTLASIQTQGTILRIRVNGGSIITHSIAVADGDYFTMAVDPTTGSVWLGVYDTSASTHQYIPAIVGGSAGDPAAGTLPTATPFNTTSGHLKCITTGGYQTGSSTTLALTAASMPMSIPTGFVEFTQDNLESSDQFISAFSWIKNRDATDNHMLFDRVRGVTKDMHSNDTAAQVTNVNTLQSFLAGGVQVGNDVEVNTANESYVLWNWMMEATGSGASNEDGSINTTSTLVDTTLGMSISTYTGTGANATLGHGLGVVPEMVICKGLDTVNHWVVYHKALGNTSALLLNATNAQQSADAKWWNNTTPTSSLVTLGTAGDSNASTKLFVMYAFAPSQFISIGSWSGNTNVDGPFVPTLNSLGIPISPIWILFKRSSAAGQNWQIFDRGLNPNNVARYGLPPNVTDAQTDWTNALDFVTGGIKVRVNNTTINNGTYIYMAIGTPIIDTDGRIIAGR